MKETTIGGIFMPRKYTHLEKYEKEILDTNLKTQNLHFPSISIFQYLKTFLVDFIHCLSYGHFPALCNYMVG